MKHALQAKAIVRAYFDRLLNEHDLAVCAELLAPDYVDHDAPADTPPGPQSTVDYARAFIAEYPDLQVQIEDIMAEDNKVTARITWRGSSATSGEPLQLTGLVLLYLSENGQIVERWSAYKAA